METTEFASKRGRENEEEEIEGFNQPVGSNGSKAKQSRNTPSDDSMSKKKMDQNKGGSNRDVGKGARDKEKHNGSEYSHNERIHEHARFVYLKSEMAGIPMTKANPFRITEAVNKVVKGDVKKIKPLKSGDLLIETVNKEQVESLCKMKRIGEMPVSVRVAKQFNMCKGVIFAPSLRDMEESQIVDELRECKVIQAKFISKGPSRVRTPLIILTFETSALPTEIKCGYLNVKVDKYIPSPLRCYKCNGFGHTASVCKKNVSCTKCAEAHVRDECINMDVKCSNCQSTEHGALDRNCPVFKKEKEIVNIKVNFNVTYYEARKKFEALTFANVVKNDSGRNREDVVNSNVNEPMNLEQGNEKEIANGGSNVEDSILVEQQNFTNESRKEHGAVGGSNKSNVPGKDDVEIMALILNLTKILNRNPGKLTIQARQISNLIFKVTKQKIEVSEVIQAIQ